MAESKVKDETKKEAPPWKTPPNPSSLEPLAPMPSMTIPAVAGGPSTFPPAPSAYDVEQQRLAQWRAGMGVQATAADGAAAPQPAVSVGAPGSAERRLATWQAQYARQAAIEARQQ